MNRTTDMIDFHSQLAIIPSVYETATLTDNLEHGGGLSIAWNAASDEEIAIGSKVEYEGVKYILMSPYAPTRTNVYSWRYEPSFSHPCALLARIPFWIKSKNAEGQDINLRTIPFTGYPHVICQKLADFFLEYYTETEDEYFNDVVGTAWTVNIEAPADPKAVITVNFDGCTIKSAATAIAEAMGCNVYFDWNIVNNKRTIRFIKGSTIDGEVCNCYHVLGGTTNMAKVALNGGYAAVTQRLTLDESIYKGSIIDRRPVDGEGHRTGIRLITDLVFDEVYPKMELYIKAVHERKCYLTDEQGAKIVDHWELNNETVPEGTEGATPVYKLFSKWYIRLTAERKSTAAGYANASDYPFTQSQIINDKLLSILFQPNYDGSVSTSPLTSRQFELVNFPPNSRVAEWDENDVLPRAQKYIAGDGDFNEYRIAFVAEGDEILPSTSEKELVPKVGNKVTLVNIALGDTETNVARAELLASANDVIDGMETPSGDYTETMLNTTIPSIGSESPFKPRHGGIVTQLNKNVDTGVAEVTVGTWKRKSLTGRVSDKIDYVSVGSTSATTAETKANSEDFGTLYKTTVKPDSLYVADLDSEMDAVACDEDGKVSSAIDLYSKVSAFYGASDISDSCSVTFATQATGFTVYQETAKGNTSGSQMIAGNSYPLSNGRWLRFHFNANTQIADRSEVSITISHAEHGERDCSYIVGAVKAGRGESAIIYQLLTSVSEIHVGRTDEGGYNPSTFTLDCGYTKTVGGTTMSVAKAQTTIDSLCRIFYIIHSRTQGWESQYHFYDADFSYSAATYDKIKFILYKDTSSTTLTDIDSTLVMDIETVPVIADGQPASVYYIVPSTNEIVKKGSTFVPSGNVTCAVFKSVGSEVSVPATTEYTLKKSLNGDTETEITTSDTTATSNVTIGIVYNLYVGGEKVDSKTVALVTDGDSPFIADLDNEMDSIACETDGKPSSDQEVSTNLTLYYGSNKTSSTLRVYDTNDRSGIEYSNGTERNGIKVSWSTNNNVHAVSIMFYKEATGHTPSAINGKKVFCMRLGKDSNYYYLYFVVNAIKAAEEGRSAILYSILPTASSIVKKKDGSYSVSSVSCKRQKNDGGTISDTTDGTITYFIDDNATENPYTDNTAIQASAFTKKLQFVYKIGTDIVDIETIPMIDDGADGESTWVADFDNEVDSIECNDSGIPTSTQTVSTNVWMMHGESQESSSVAVYKDEGLSQVYNNNEGAFYSGLAVWWTIGSNVNNTVNVKMNSNFNGFTDGKKNFYIKVTYGSGSSAIIRTLVFTVTANKKGETGGKGDDSRAVKLDSNSANFIYNDSDTLVSPTGFTTQARFYDGTEEKTSQVLWDIYSTFYTTATISSAGVLSVTAVTAASGKVVVRALYNGTPYYGEFMVNRLNQDTYELVLTPGDLSYNATTAPDRYDISYKARRTDLVGNVVEITAGDYTAKDKISQTAGKGYLRLFRANVTGNTIGTLSQIVSTPTGMTKANAAQYDGLYFEIRKFSDTNASNTSTDHKVVAHATVPISHVTDGIHGKSAAYISIKGGCNSSSNGSIAIFDGETTVTRTSTSQGHIFLKINRSTLAIESGPTAYNTFNNDTARNNLVTAINNAADTSFICIFSNTQIGWNDALVAALKSCGSGGVFNRNAGSYPFIFIGYKGLTEGSAVQMMGALNATHTTDAMVYVADGAMSTTEYGNMWVGLKNTGIDIEQGKITSIGDQFEWKDSNGNLALSMTNDVAEFSGTVKSKNFYHSVCFWSVGDTNTGDADLVFVGSTSTGDSDNENAMTVKLPLASSYDGKIVEIVDLRYIGNYSGSASAEVGALNVQENNGSSKHMKLHPGSSSLNMAYYINIQPSGMKDGCGGKFLAKDGYWIYIPSRTSIAAYAYRAEQLIS